MIHTDASLSGWGGHSHNHNVQGKWSPMFRQFHINILEAMAVLLALKRLKPPKKIHIRLVLDNSVVVNCLNRQGSKTPHINHVLLAIFKLAHKKKWHFSATHLQRVRNVIADSLSRQKPLESEWSLDRTSFLWILKRVPLIQVDLFATKDNHKLACYVAPNLDPQAFASDAMSID